MTKSSSIFLAIFFLWGMSPVPATEIEDLKVEIERLLQRIEDLEKKQGQPDPEVEKLLQKIGELEKQQTAAQLKADETEKKLAEVEEKAQKVEKKSLKDRVDIGGEIRFRFMGEQDRTEDGFFGNGQPANTLHPRDNTSFPLRVRLNLHAEAVPDFVDVYARVTVNKRWGSYSTAATDPFDKPNSFESSIGHDVDLRFEQAYATFKLPWDLTWYVGRLPGLDGAPSRASRSLFPRLFIDSEIDGTLLKWDAPPTALDELELPWTEKLWADAESPAPSLESYERKAKEKTGLIVGYLKYDERGTNVVHDSDVFLAQPELKIGKSTAIIFDGLFMRHWHMPRSTFKGKTSYTDAAGNRINIPDFTLDYYLGGVYLDTQIGGFQVYGAFYCSYFKIPDHTWTFYNRTTNATTSTNFNSDSFTGYFWYVGLNTGDLIGADHQFCIEYGFGSEGWINPFNYRGYRRKGTVSSPANNYYYNPAAVDTVIVGFYPFNAQVWDAYYDYYVWEKVRFRLGVMAFKYDKHDPKIGGTVSVLGSSRNQIAWWPYCEVNVSF